MTVVWTVCQTEFRLMVFTQSANYTFKGGHLKLKQGQQSTDRERERERGSELCMIEYKLCAAVPIDVRVSVRHQHHWTPCGVLHAYAWFSSEGCKLACSWLWSLVLVITQWPVQCTISSSRLPSKVSSHVGKSWFENTKSWQASCLVTPWVLRPMSVSRLVFSAARL